MSALSLKHNRQRCFQSLLLSVRSIPELILCDGMINHLQNVIFTHSIFFLKKKGCLQNIKEGMFWKDWMIDT